MSLITSILTGGTNSHETTSEEANYHGTDLFNPGVVGPLGNTSGVAPTTGNFAVNAQGTPDMTVAVSAGACYVTATPSGGNSQLVRVKNTASANTTISANSTGGTRYDWLYVKIDATAAANPAADGSDVASLVTSRSTSASTDNGTPPTYGTLLAVVTVANGASSITNGNIADWRLPVTHRSSPETNSVNFVDVVSSATGNPVEVRAKGNDTDIDIKLTPKGAGQVILGRPIACRAYRDAAFTIGSLAKVVLDTENYDLGSDFATGTFTAPVTGYYQVNAVLGAVNVADANQVLARIYVNGSAAARATGISSYASGDPSVAVGDLVYAEAGQTIELWAEGSASVNGSVGTSSTFMSVYFVGTD